MTITPDGPLWMALTILVGIVLLKHSGYANKITRGIGFLVASALFFFLEAATSMGFWTLAKLAYAQEILILLWSVIAWALLLLSAFIVAVKLIKMK